MMPQLSLYHGHIQLYKHLVLESFVFCIDQFGQLAQGCLLLLVLHTPLLVLPMTRHCCTLCFLSYTPAHPRLLSERWCCESRGALVAVAVVQQRVRVVAAVSVVGAVTWIVCRILFARKLQRPLQCALQRVPTVCPTDPAARWLQQLHPLTCAPARRAAAGVALGTQWCRAPAPAAPLDATHDSNRSSNHMIAQQLMPNHQQMPNHQLITKV